jgi:hypothetical protein
MRETRMDSKLENLHHFWQENYTTKGGTFYTTPGGLFYADPGGIFYAIPGGQ